MFNQFNYGNHNRFSPIQFSLPIQAGGRHLLIELSECNPEILDSQERVFEIMKECVDAVGATVINQAFHKFEPQGVSGILLLSESHCSIHTWPEHGKASIDFYTCGDCKPDQSDVLFMAGFEARKMESVVIDRTKGISVDDIVKKTYEDHMHSSPANNRNK